MIFALDNMMFCEILSNFVRDIRQCAHLTNEKMRRLLYIFSVVLLLLLHSCTSAEVKQRLTLAESMLSECPYSSLVVHEHHYQDHVVNKNVIETVTNYRDCEHTVYEKNLLFGRTIRTIVVVVLVSIIILVSIIAYQRIKSQKQEIEDNIIQAANLCYVLQTKEDETLSLRNSYDKEIERKTAENLKLYEAINSLFEQRFATIDKLSSAYYEYQGSANEKQKIYTEVMKLVNGLGSDKNMIKELESFINIYKDNLLVRFKNEFPDIKDSDYTLYIYMVAGFSSRAISIFIGENIDVVYNRKSRLKQRINKNNSMYKEEFLSPLS